MACLGLEVLVNPEIEQYSMMFDEFVPDVDVEKLIKPVDPPVLPPLSEIYRMVLLCAPLIKRIVLADEERLVLVKVSATVEPVRFTRPSRVTLSAPFKSSNAPASETS